MYGQYSRPVCNQERVIVAHVWYMVLMKSLYSCKEKSTLKVRFHHRIGAKYSIQFGMANQSESRVYFIRTDFHAPILTFKFHISKCKYYFRKNFNLFLASCTLKCIRKRYLVLMRFFSLHQQFVFCHFAIRCTVFISK